MQTVQFRVAAAADVIAVSELVYEAGSRIWCEAGSDDELEAWLEEHATAARWHAHLTDPSSYTVLAVSGDQVVGVARLESRIETAYFDGFYVETLQHGIGNGLFAMLLKRAQELNHIDAHAEVWELNDPARRFCERHGFTLDGWHDDPTFAGAQLVDYRALVKNLTV